jgi:hypothetical protein
MESSDFRVIPVALARCRPVAGVAKATFPNSVILSLSKDQLNNRDALATFTTIALFL